ncbi:MAG TPA: fibronectin type III domain-containing protein, partial [Actinomycetes bacterium]|nr:fibronectin type III domain-containing protein [Actinomycetes bacterium]
MFARAVRWVAWTSAIAVALSPISLPVLASAADSPVRIMLVGDSITEGSSGDWTWRYRLARYLDAAGVDYEFVGPRSTMYDLGTGKHTSMDYVDPGFDTDHFARWGELLRQFLDEYAAPVEDSIGWAVSTYKPDVVVEVLGVNDMIWGATPEETLALAKRFVQEVRAAEPNARLVLSKIPSVQIAGVADYNDLLESTASEWSTGDSPVVVSDPAQQWSTDGDTCDSLHPNAVGEVKIAAAEADALAGLGIGNPVPRPLPTPPAGPRLPAVLDVTRGDGHAFMAWTLPPGGDAVLISTRDITAGDAWRQLPYAIGGSSWDSQGLINGHTYEYRLNVLKHRCVAADISSNVVSVTPEPDVPGSVAGISVTPVDHGLLASWSATYGALNYSVWVKPSDGRAGWTTHHATTKTLTVDGLEAGRSYDVAVQARNDGGDGPISDPLQVVPIGERPPAPEWRSSASSALGTVTVTWNPVPHANGYRLAYRIAQPGVTWVQYPAALNTRSALVTGLRDGQRYFFRVRGADDQVIGPWSTRRAVSVPLLGPV